MAYRNFVMDELMVPYAADTAERLRGFYNGIGWTYREHTKDPRFVYVQPVLDIAELPVIGYWQTDNAIKLAKFVTEPEVAYADKSTYARGLHLPVLQDMVEVCLVVPDNRTVDALYKRGGRLLAAHTHIKPRNHAGVREFRLADPYNYSLRVTADPGWELTAPEVEPENDLLEVRKDDFAELRGKGAGISWGQLIRLAMRNPGFPLRYDTTRPELLSGSVKAALKWHDDQPTTAGKEKPVYYSLLKQLLDAHNELASN